MKNKNPLPSSFLLILFLLTFSFSYAVGESTDPSRSSFIGVCSHITRETKAHNPYSSHKDLLNTMRSGNIHFTRTGFKWRIIHPTHDEWNWKITDAVVASAKERNVNILALVGAMPRWVGEAPQEHVDLWVEFVDSLSSRYKNDIFYWEIWNEPNTRSGKYWPQDALPDLFATYVIQAGQAIRKNQPEATILLGGLTTSKKANPFGLWTSLFELGVLNAVDGIAYHPYQFTGVELMDFNQQLNQLVSKYTPVKKELWITEYGVPAIDSDKYPQFSYATQRNNILKTILIHWATGGTKFFIYSLWDEKEYSSFMNAKDLRQNRQGYFGLLEMDMSPKPSYLAVRWLSRLLDEYDPVELQNNRAGILISVKHKISGEIHYFSWGAGIQKELVKDMSQKGLTRFETDEATVMLTEVKSKVLKRHRDDILFWR